MTKTDRTAEIPTQLSSDEIALRKRWLNLSDDDERLIAQFDELLQSRIEELIERMYDHFLSFPETSQFFPDKDTLHRAQKAQAEYFRRLTKGNYDVQYVADRLQVGATHYRVGLDPKYYLGAYGRILTWFSELLLRDIKEDPDRYMALKTAITKIVFFDLSLAIDAYTTAKENAIRQQRDAIAELETERRVTKSILENAPIGIIRLDSDLNCIECNQEFLEIVDSENHDSIIGKSILEIVPHMNTVQLRKVLESGQPHRRSADAINLSTMAGQVPTYWDWAAWPVKDHAGNSIGMVALFMSATDRVLLQQQREDFVATLTHDLKTPILAANRAIKLLIDGDFGAVSESQAGVLETIHQSNDSLYKLVQTLLDVYRYDSGAKELSLQKTCISRMLESMIEELSPLAHNKSIDVSLTLPETEAEVDCDPAEIRRVVQNLIDNSLKFTPSGGRINISMSQNGDTTTISVEDTGKGISEQDKPKLFQRFWQASSSSGRYYASTGLGLYLCRKIVELHGGRIWCISNPGDGSKFTFTIENRRALPPVA